MLSDLSSNSSFSINLGLYIFILYFGVVLIVLIFIVNMDKRPTDKSLDLPQTLVDVESGAEGGGDTSSHESQDDDDIIVLQEQSRIFSTIHEGDVSSAAYHALKTSYDVIAQRTRSQNIKIKQSQSQKKQLQSQIKQLQSQIKQMESKSSQSRLMTETDPEIIDSGKTSSVKENKQITYIKTRDISCQTLISGNGEIEMKELKQEVENLKGDNYKLLEENKKLKYDISEGKEITSVSQTQTDSSISVDAEKSLVDSEISDNKATEAKGIAVSAASLPTDDIKDITATGARPKQRVKSQRVEGPYEPEEQAPLVQGHSESSLGKEEGEMTAKDLQAVETVNKEIEILKEKVLENKDVVKKLIEGFKQLKTIPPREKKDDVPLAMPIEEESHDHEATIYPPDISSLQMSRTELARGDQLHSMRAAISPFSRMRVDDTNIFYPPVGDEEQPSESRVEAQGETGEQHFVQPVEEGSTPLPPGISRATLDMSSYSFHPLPQEMKTPVFFPPESLEAVSLGQSGSGPRDPGDGMSTVLGQGTAPAQRLSMERSGSDIRAAMEMASQNLQPHLERVSRSDPGSSQREKDTSPSAPQVDISLVREPPGPAYVPQLPPSISGQPSSFEEVSIAGAAAAASSAGVTVTTSTSEPMTCPVCNTTFAHNFPVGDFIMHVNSHFDEDTGDFHHV